jgi:hypothetical protein
VDNEKEKLPQAAMPCHEYGKTMLDAALMTI